MPPRKTYARKKRVFKRKSFNRVKGVKRYTTNVPKSLGPIAPRSIVSMRYNSQWTQSAIVPDYVFNLNSVFDPDSTGVGHQPFGRDTFNTLYNRYRVFAVSGVLKTSSTATSTKVAIVATNSAIAMNNISLVSEMPHSQSRTVATSNISTIKFKYFLPKITGVTTTTYRSDDSYQALTGSSPSELICLHILGTDLLGGPVTANSQYQDLTLNYHVEWYDPLPLGQS